MLYFRLLFDEMPKVTFAHTFTDVNYSMDFNGGKNDVEIVYIEKGSTMFETCGIEEMLDENSILFVFKKYKSRFRPVKEVLHTHYTVNISFEHKLDVSGEPGEDGEPLILPLYIKLDKNTSHFEQKLKSLLKEYNSHSTACSYKCSAMALDLLAEISRCSVPKMKAVNQDYSPMQYIISNRVKEYVANNLDKAIQLADIAKEIHKTPNYLNYIFKKVNGITIKQYINREKISKVIQLGTNYNMSLKDAGEYVGLHDQNYLSRLFKKVTSLSFTDYINSLGTLPPVTTEND